MARGDLRSVVWGMLRESVHRPGQGKGTRLSRLRNIEDVRREAGRRDCPMPLTYVDGGAEDEITQRANRAAFAQVTLKPRILVDVSRRDLSTTVLGQRVDFPVLLAPTGLPGLQHADAELGAARAAHAAGTVFAISTAASYSVGEVAAHSPGPMWFQLYPWTDRAVTEACIDQARAAGCGALILTVDAAVPGNRERDLRAGMTLPPRLTTDLVAGALRHPVRYGRWLRTLAAGPGMRLGNVAGTVAPPGGAVGVAGWFEGLFNPSLTWKDLEWIRERWQGPLALKGIITAEQARQAADAGADAVIVSNHGGRQLDCLPASLHALPAIADALADTPVEVLLDGGIRRGSDVLKALALGARACLIGRPWVWGLAAAGGPGVTRVLDILHTELDRSLALMGVSTVTELDRSMITLPSDWPTLT